MSDIILSRQHRILDARDTQLRNNLAAIAGGRPYIDLRLHRAPNESDLSWKGSSDGSVSGRQTRAYVINDAGRIAGKVNQYLFAQPAKRDGIGDEFSADCTTTGWTIDRFWERVSEAFTGGQWVWLRVDRGAPDRDTETGQPRMRTLAQREAAGDRVYWSIYTSRDVVDWSFDESGRLLWLIAKESVYDNADPEQPAKAVDVRMLWRRNQAGATWERWQEGEDGKAALVASGSISAPEIPFVLLGEPSDAPWWFDDVELVQAALMNLASLHHENLVRTVYPQLVIPQAMVENLQARLVERAGSDRGGAVTELVREIIRGLDRPFVEDAENSGITRYLMPSAADLSAIPSEEDRRRKALFDMVGLALFNRESRQVQSAESKQFDHLDTAATLANRAMLLRDAERKMVALSQSIDSTFAAYDPIWPTDFDVRDTQGDVVALTQLANMGELPPSMKRATLRAGLRLLEQIAPLEAEQRAEVLEEIEAMGAEPAGADDDPLGLGFTPPG